MSIESAALIGRQLHLGPDKLHRDIAAVTMDRPGHRDTRPMNQPWGGMWTSTLYPGPTSPYTDTLDGLSDPAAYRAAIERTWWVLAPDPSAQLAVVNSPDDYAGLLRAYRYRGSFELDYPALAQSDVAGLHVTTAGIANCPELEYWVIPMTIWFRWGFIGKPERIDPPARLMALASAGATERSADDRIAVHGPFAGSWVRVQRPAADFRERLSTIMALRHGVSSPQAAKWYFVAASKLILDELVIDHDFVSDDGAGLPVGEGFCQSLGHIDIAIAIVRQIGKHLPNLL